MFSKKMCLDYLRNTFPRLEDVVSDYADNMESDCDPPESFWNFEGAAGLKCLEEDFASWVRIQDYEEGN